MDPIDHSRKLTHHHLREEPIHMIHIRQELGAHHAAHHERETDESPGPDAE